MTIRLQHNRMAPGVEIASPGTDPTIDRAPANAPTRNLDA